MAPDFYPRLLRLRLLVLILGEAHHAQWWPSQFLHPIGLRHLRRIYPRSYFSAAVKSAQQAAQVVHDKDLGATWAFHLMRLPLELEDRVDRQLRDHEAQLTAEFTPKLTDRPFLMAELGRLGGATFPTQPTGLWRLGAAETQSWEHWARLFASAYHSALSREGKVFPFVELEAVEA